MMNLLTWLSGWTSFGPPQGDRTIRSAPAVDVPLPDRRAREACLSGATRSLTLAPDVDLALLARTTTGLTDVDLTRLCEKAGRMAAAEGGSQAVMAHFEEALDAVVLAGARPALLETGERSLAAYHEAGHVLVAWLTRAATPPEYASILSHAGPRHSPEPRPRLGPQVSDLASLLARLDVLLAGSAAEALATGEVSEAGESDSRQAATLAGRIVRQWGPSAAYSPSPASGGEAMRAGDDLDAAARLLVERHAAAVRNLVAGARPMLDTLAEELVAEEAVDASRLETLLGPRPSP